jgi:hypothetical protein
MQEHLAATVIGLIKDKPRLAEMGKAMAALATPNAAAKIAKLLRGLGHKEGKR